MTEKAGYRIEGLRPFSKEQRHQSWRLATHRGPLWVKVESVSSPVAGVARESLVLSRLDGHFSHVPQLVAAGHLHSGAPYMVTTEVGGRQMSNGAPSERTLSTVASGLRTFGECAVFLPSSLRWTVDDLFGDQPYLPALLLAASAGIRDAHLQSIAAHLADTEADESAVLLHGSLDPTNVMIDCSDQGRMSGFLDLEATRWGPASYDIATMATGVARLWGAPSSLRWVSMCERIFANVPRTRVAGFMILRAAFRSAAGELSDTERSSILRVSEHLAGRAIVSTQRNE